MQQEIIEGFRLSPQQEHLWLLQQGDSRVYRAECVLLIEGALKVDVLKRAVGHIADRHEILRTTFHQIAGMAFPVQVITDDGLLSFEEHDLSGCSFQEQEASVEALVQEADQRPFDFEQGPLLRASLLTLSSDKHMLLISLPALCADAVTLKNLAREIDRAYAACSHDEDLTGEPMQYVDFAEWQNEILETEESDAGKEYWRNQDISALLTLKLPFEKQPSEKSEFKPASLSVTINADVVTRIKAITASYDISASMMLLACWQVLLWRLTWQSDAAVAAAYSGRKYEGMEAALGLFAKYLPVHCSLDENIRFSELLKWVCESSSQVHEWQEYFTWEDFKGSSVDKDGSSFFPFCFEFEDQSAKYASTDVSFSLYRQGVRIDRFKVRLFCIDKDGGLTAEFHYDSNLFSAKAADRLARQYCALLESATDNPEAAISELKILSDAERQQLLVEFNETKTGYSKDRCVHEMFEAQAGRTPDAVAVVYEDRQLTYRELNSRANRLARHLQGLGVGPETLVAICVERSLEMVIGLLGVLKAGGGYVPLDPTLPKQRLTFMLEDTRAQVLLTQQRLAERLPEHAAEVIWLDTRWDVIARQSEENVISKSASENTVYVIFTSGSTGLPKGVAVEHRQLLNYVNAILEKLYLPTGSTFAMVSTFAADLGNTALFPSLCSGGSLHIVGQDRATDPDALADYFRRHRIDCLKIVPSHLTALLSSSHPEQILPRQRLVLGGEGCGYGLIERLHLLAPDCLVLNHYGPTEATVGAATYRVENGHADYHATALPIGRPLANMRIHLLDSRLQPVPLGVSGELHIGGDGLARGYLNRPDLTADKFIPDPFCLSPGARLYKTGDLARYLDDGNIEFLGRLDNQVKIRGFRIELGEIEAVLAQHPGVREAFVMAREDEPGHKRLVAYLVPAYAHAPTVSDLHSFVKQELPEYMVPAAFVMLKAMPLTTNGKLDRRSLPLPSDHRAEVEGTFVAARTGVEEVLANIWCQVLGLKRVGIQDNFFELGGDSILAIQVIARANQAGVGLTPKQLFQHQTIAELASVASVSRAMEIEQGEVTGSVLLTPIQCRFFEQDLSEPHHYNQSIMLQVLPGLLPLQVEHAVRQLLAHHDALRLRFIREETGWQQVNAGLDEAVPFSEADLSLMSESQQETAMAKAAAELQASLDLSEGPLVRVAYFRLGPQKPGRLLLIIHHLAVDGVSWRILVEDLQAACRQLSCGEAVSLPPKTTSFKQWADYLAGHAQSGAVQQELAYWLDERQTQVSRLPVDYAGGTNTKASARTVSVSLSEEETRALLQDVSAAYHTQINDVLLTALAQAFESWTGSRRLLLDLEGHGREEILEGLNLSRTVGWFTTVFPLLLEIGESSAAGDALKSIKEQLRAIPNRGIGYGLLRYLSRDVENAEKLRALPQAEVTFNYLGQFDQLLTEPSLFRRAKESSGPAHSLKGVRPYLLTINSHIMGGLLQMNWTYSENIHRRATVERLAQSFLEALRSLIAHCQASAAGSFTPSDFPHAKLSQKDLNKVLARIGSSTGSESN